MTIERLEELTDEYLIKMNLRVNKELVDKEGKALSLEHQGITNEFVNIFPSILEKYTKYFEFNPMNAEMNLSSRDTIQKIYEEIVTIKRELEKGNEISRVKQKGTQRKPQEDNFRRKQEIKETLQDVFTAVEHEMRGREEPNIDWDNLRVYSYRIISHYIETIEQNVFEKNEDDMIQKEVERYIEEIEQELKNEKSEDMKLEFKDGPVCPVVADTDEFARVNRELANDIQEQQETSQNEPTRNDNGLGPLEPIL